MPEYSKIAEESATKSVNKFLFKFFKKNKKAKIKSFQCR